MKPLVDILAEIRVNIAAACARVNRDPNEVEIIAVTKTHGEEVVREARDAGLRIVGENKVQEAAWKKLAAVGGMDWHLIGHLQSNKVRHALEIFDFIHSVDSLKLLERINAVAEETGASPHILLELNVAGESSKTGMKPADLDATLEALISRCPRVTLEGLMTMAPYSPKAEDARPYFRRLRELRDAAEKKFGLVLPRLSMGMSGDYQVAVEEGATWLRLGTILFGERPKLSRKLPPSDESADYSQGLDSYSGAGPTVRILD